MPTVAAGRGLPSAARSIALRLYGDYHYGRWLRLRHFKHVVRRLPLHLDTADILDAGCGNGATVRWLAERYPLASLLGVDVDIGQIEHCRSRARSSGLNNATFDVANLENIDLGRKFDFVYVIHVLEHLPQDDVAVSNLSRCLNPGGILLVDVPDAAFALRDNYGMRRFIPGPNRSGEHVRVGYSVEELKGLLEGAGLRVRGTRFAFGPPALFAHTVFELLRRGHWRLYFLVLPVLRLVGYADLLFSWKHGASLMMWAESSGNTRSR
jgi:SAM-dependent methyltransferase